MSIWPAASEKCTLNADAFKLRTASTAVQPLCTQISWMDPEEYTVQPILSKHLRDNQKVLA